MKYDFPKIDLHLHLDGSMLPESAWEMAKERNVKMPADNLEDFKKFISDNPDISIVEMDTVEGVKGGKLLLTLLLRQFNFMLAFILPDKTPQSVIDVFNELTDKLGLETFKNIFSCILTDNGVEFSNPDALEKTKLNETRCKIFYCDARHSEQKRKN